VAGSITPASSLLRISVAAFARNAGPCRAGLQLNAMLRSIDDAQTAWRPHIRVRLEHPQDLLLELRVFKVRQVDRVAPIGWLRSDGCVAGGSEPSGLGDVRLPHSRTSCWKNGSLRKFSKALPILHSGVKMPIGLLIAYASAKCLQAYVAASKNWKYYEEACVRLNLCNFTSDS